MEMGNPILNQGFVVAGRTHRLTSPDAEPPKSKPNIPPAIKRMIGELGLRYRPTSQVDLEAHAASIALLASDLYDMPPHILEKAIGKHVLSSPYLPKASDLVAIARTFVDRDPGTHGPKGETMAQRGNRLMSPEGLAKGLRWYEADGGSAFLDFAA